MLEDNRPCLIVSFDLLKEYVSFDLTRVRDGFLQQSIEFACKSRSVMARSQIRSENPAMVYKSKSGAYVP